ncbi:helix-turn-helix domain-containing protein [Parvularcula sp. IMCC14364]|uniref:helix-turn-helix domain-containing protein n=1 Tax=Parvularcula sp. IMCC14364 TaxID=3067902 RepID=UPI002740AADF|nr:helix-turn-helix domain-containing protein [Parvularcula sp. IMCC14364]
MSADDILIEATADKPLTNEQAANYLGMKASTLNRWRCSGVGPRFLKVGRLIKYRKSDLDAYLQGRVFQSTAECASKL